MKVLNEVKLALGTALVSGLLLTAPSVLAETPAVKPAPTAKVEAVKAAAAAPAKEAAKEAAPAKDAVAEVKKGDKKDPMAAAMEVMKAAMTPGPEHAKLKGMTGTWTWAAKAWMAPGAPANESTGQSEYKMILGDRYLEEASTGTMMGQPFEGRGTVAYDNTAKKFMGTWIDNMGTGIMTSEGTFDASGKKLTSAASMVDPMTKKVKKLQMIRTMDSDTKCTLEMFDKVGGKPFKMMEVVYTKKG